MGALLEMENGLLFYEIFFITLYRNRTHSVQLLTEVLKFIYNFQHNISQILSVTINTVMLINVLYHVGYVLEFILP